MTTDRVKMSVHQPLSGVVVDSMLACLSVRLGRRKQFGHGSWQDILQTFSTRFCTKGEILQERGGKLAAKFRFVLKAGANAFC